MFKVSNESMEQQVLQNLTHKNIIVFKRILFSISHVFIEMEKINGGTLEKFITSRVPKLKLGTRRRSMIYEEEGSTSEPKKLIEPVVSEEVAASIMKDICNGLSQIHK
jgi:serine/threonine protein kinase